MLSKNLLHRKISHKFLIDIYCFLNENFDIFFLVLFVLLNVICQIICLYKIKGKTFNFVYLIVKIMLSKNRKQILFQYDLFIVEKK